MMTVEQNEKKENPTLAATEDEEEEEEKDEPTASATGEPTRVYESSHEHHDSDPDGSATCPTCPKCSDWFTTYAQRSFKGDRAATKPLDLLAQIQREAQPGADNHAIGLIMPSTFHKLQVRNQDLPVGAEMHLYCGIADLDAEPHHAGSKKALKQAIQTGVQSGMTWAELCAACPDFANVARAAEMLCAKLREKNFTGSRLRRSAT